MGNGKFMVALDKNMNVRDFFYPNVGLENHVGGHLFRFGAEKQLKAYFPIVKANVSSSKFNPVIRLEASRTRLPRLPNLQLHLVSQNFQFVDEVLEVVHDAAAVAEGA